MTAIGNPYSPGTDTDQPPNSTVTKIGKPGTLPTTVGNLTINGTQTYGAVVYSSTVTFSTAASRIIPGATSLSFRNNANSADNLLISNAGLVTTRLGIVIASGALTISDAASKIIPGATSLSLRNNGDSADNLLISNAGAVTVRAGLTITASNLTFGAASAKIIPGATSLLFRDTGDANTNLGITDAGVVTTRGAITPTGGIAATAGGATAPTVYHSGGITAVATTTGTDVTPSVTETYIVEVFVPFNCTLTGVSILNGSAVVGNVKISLADSTGAPIAAAVTASTAQSGTAAFQKVPFAVPYVAVGPQKFFVLLQHNNTGNRFRAHAVGNFGASKKTGETYGTFTSVTPPTTFTADLGPICDVY